MRLTPLVVCMFALTTVRVASADDTVHVEFPTRGLTAVVGERTCRAPCVLDVAPGVYDIALGRARAHDVIVRNPLRVRASAGVAVVPIALGGALVGASVILGVLGAVGGSFEFPPNAETDASVQTTLLVTASFAAVAGLITLIAGVANYLSVGRHLSVQRASIEGVRIAF